jgi:hypothetical protein
VTDAAIERDRLFRQQFAQDNVSEQASHSSTAKQKQCAKADATTNLKDSLKAVVTDPKTAAQRATDAALERERQLREEFAKDCSREENEQTNSMAKEERSVFFGDADAAEPGELESSFSL